MNERYDKIDRYLSDEMSERELADFSQMMAADEELAGEVVMLRTARESISRQAATEEEMAELRSVMNKAATATPKRRPVVKRLWVRIASLAAAVAIAVILWLGWPGSGSLYQQYATHPSLEMVQRGPGSQEPEQALEVAFNQEDYAKASQLIEEYAAAKGWDTELRLFAGISQLEQEKFTAATEQFMLLRQGESANKWVGTWYLALTYLKQAEAGDAAAYQQSEQVLREIPEGVDYYDQAGSLLLALRKAGLI